MRHTYMYGFQGSKKMEAIDTQKSLVCITTKTKVISLFLFCKLIPDIPKGSNCLVEKTTTALPVWNK